MTETRLSDIRALPKAVLHDHLDGGLRPQTIIELAAEVGHPLPTQDADELRQWFVDASSAGSLERFLETFEHTLAVMQTAESLHRVAYEAVIDLSDDGVVLAELRYAPEQHTSAGLSLNEVVEAVQSGIDSAIEDVRARGADIAVGTLITAMRHANHSDEIAELAVRYRDNGNIGFDIAGAESGFPASDHASAFDYLHRHFLPATVHAGESEGPESIADALHAGYATRIGHGVRIIEDIDFSGDEPRLGRVATWVRDRGIALELCPTSNTQTGAARDVSTHPITVLRDLGFTVTINTDNRLMCGTSVSGEMLHLVEQAGWTDADLLHATMAAINSSFLPADVRERIVEEYVVPRYEELIEGAGI